MTWLTVSPYCIRSGSYRIAKVIIKGVPRYELWRDREKLTSARHPEPLKALAERDQAELDQAEQEGTR